MDNRSNTIAGWVLGASVVFLGAWLVTGEIFSDEAPEKQGYAPPGVEEEGAGAAEQEQPIAAFLQTADATRGQAVFAKCGTCHTITNGGANGLGPNLWGRMGAPIAAVAGYSYSEPLKAHASETWGWDNMSAWLASPRTFAPGTKMTFAGLSDPQDRADLLVYLNAQGGNLQLPPPPATGGGGGSETPEENAARAADAPAQGDMGAPQPVPTRAETAQQPAGRTGGPGAEVAGTGDQPAPKGH
jgi:cytochrome c